MARIVIALGGNALQKSQTKISAKDQLLIIKETVKSIADLIIKNNTVVIVHGNGPQVGRLVIQNEIANSLLTPAQPFDVCGAMSQASIGYHLQQALKRELKQRNFNNFWCYFILLYLFILKVL